jgi:PAS domain S-box-containing protein
VRKESNQTMTQRRAQRRGPQDGSRVGRSKRLAGLIEVRGVRLRPIPQPAGASTAAAGMLEGRHSPQRALLESATDAYLAVDVHDIIQDSNPAATALLHLPHPSLVGSPLARFFGDAPGYAAFRTERRRHRRLHRAWNWETRLQASDGQHFGAVLSIVAVSGAKGTPVGWRCLFRAVSERDRADAGRLAEMRQQDRFQGVVLSGRALGHLLNNDLVAAVGVIELLLTHPELPEDLRSLTDAAAISLSTMTKHIAQLQSVVRVETQDTPVGPMLDVERSIAQSVE